MAPSLLLLYATSTTVPTMPWEEVPKKKKTSEVLTVSVGEDHYR